MFGNCCGTSDVEVLLQIHINMATMPGTVRNEGFEKEKEIEIR